MKSIRYILVALIGLVSLSAAAQADYRLGLCDNSRTISDKSITLGGKCDLLSAAIYLSGSDLAKVSGGKFTGVNVGLNNTFNVSSITGWIRTELDGEDLAAATISKETNPSLSKGWNAIKFETPLEIKPDQGYYIGYSMQHSKGLGVAYMAIHTGASAEGGCWTNTDGKNWVDNKEMGVLFLEALIQSDKLPVRDIRIIDAKFDHDVYSQGSQIGLDLNLQNMGLETVTSFDLTLGCDDAGISITRTIDCNIPYNDRYSTTQKYVLPEMEVNRSFTFTVSVDKVNGEPDQFEDDNTVTLEPLPSIERMFERTVVLEEFTTEKCKNCPNAANHVRYMLNGLTEQERERTAVLCHHSGFYTDGFTQACDKSYTCFYGPKGTFAPAFMIDRIPQASNTTVFELTNYVNLIERVRNRMAEPAYYSIETRGEWSVTERKVRLTISGVANRQICSDTRITVYITEDDVKAVSQSGTSNPDYRHQHLIRAYNSTWGENPQWSDERNYSYNCELTYPDGCDPEKMEILAMISNYDESNTCNRQLQNACKVELMKLKSGTTGIEAPVAPTLSIRAEDSDIRIDGDYDSIQVFDLSGRAMPRTGLPAGIYLVRVSTASGIQTARITIR